MQIHPLQCDYGVGDTTFALDSVDPGWRTSPKRREYVDLFLATTIGYGNMGWLVNEFTDAPFHAEAMARSYYMLQQLQQQYAFVHPRLIEYAGKDGTMLTPSAAHATGAMAGSRLHVVYENGTEIFVNRGDWGNWTVKDQRGESVTLPSSGWLAFNSANSFYELSALVDGHRIDHVTASEFEFLDGRGKWTQRGNVGAAGSVALRHVGQALELTDIYGNTRIAFRSPHPGKLTASDAEGKALGTVETKLVSGWYEFQPLAAARSYRFE